MCSNCINIIYIKSTDIDNPGIIIPNVLLLNPQAEQIPELNKSPSWTNPQAEQIPGRYYKPGWRPITHQFCQIKQSFTCKYQKCTVNSRRTRRGVHTQTNMATRMHISMLSTGVEGRATHGNLTSWGYTWVGILTTSSCPEVGNFTWPPSWKTGESQGFIGIFMNSVLSYKSGPQGQEFDP